MEEIYAVAVINLKDENPDTYCDNDILIYYFNYFQIFI